MFDIWKPDSVAHLVSWSCINVEKCFISNLYNFRFNQLPLPWHEPSHHTFIPFFFFASLFTKDYLEANSNSHTKSVMKCFIKTYQNIYHTRIRIKIRTIIIINTLQFDSGWFPNYFAVFFFCFVGILFCWASLLIRVFKRMSYWCFKQKNPKENGWNAPKMFATLALWPFVVRYIIVSMMYHIFI